MRALDAVGLYPPTDVKLLGLRTVLAEVVVVYERDEGTLALLGDASFAGAVDGIESWDPSPLSPWLATLGA